MLLKGSVKCTNKVCLLVVYLAFILLIPFCSQYHIFLCLAAAITCENFTHTCTSLVYREG